MLTGEDAHLYSALSQYGYSLLPPDEMADPNDLLARLSRTRDVRLLEGFPVVLANALGKRAPEVDLLSAERRLAPGKAREKLRKLAALSFYLLDVFGFEELKAPAERRAGRWRAYLRELREAVEENRPLQVGDKQLDLERVKRTFLRYFVRDQVHSQAADKARLKEDLKREYLLSLLLSPRQRDLMGKKLGGEPMTKTEREYFSRVVKKKLQALADPDLHRMAQKALQ